MSKQETICPSCKALIEIEIILPENEKRAIRDLIQERDKLKADIKKLSNTWNGILKLLNLQGKSGNNILMQLPGFLLKIQKNPEMFNFISPDIREILDTYADGI